MRSWLRRRSLVRAVLRLLDMDFREISHRFAYHAPKDADVKAAHEAIRAACRAAAHIINDKVPDSHEKDIAIRKLEAAMMWANAAIARHSGG